MYIIIADLTEKHHIPLAVQLRAAGYTGFIELDKTASKSDRALVIGIPAQGSPFVQAPTGPRALFSGTSHADLAQLALVTLRSVDMRGGL